MDLHDVITELRQLDEPTPIKHPLPTTVDIHEAEMELKTSFPEDLKTYLLLGSNISYGILEPVCIIPNNSHNNIVNVTNDARHYNIVSEDLIPICLDNDNYYCINPEGVVGEYCPFVRP